MKNNKYVFLTKNIGLFGIGNLFPKILAFIMIPIYTQKITVYEFGMIELINTTIQLLLPIFSLSIQEAVLRFVFDSSLQKKHVLSAAIGVVLLGTAAIAVGMWLLSVWNVFSFDGIYLFYILILFLVDAIGQSMTRFCRGIDHVATIVMGALISSVIASLLKIFLLFTFNLGIHGYIISDVLGTICSILYILFRAKLYRYLTIKIPKDLVRSMIRYSLPLIFSALAWWVNNASDRYILSWLQGISAGGIYAMSNKIPSIAVVLQVIIQQAWSISVIKEFSKNDEDGFIGNTFTIVNFMTFVVCSAIMIFNIPIAHLLYSGEFIEAWKYVPILLVATVLNGASLFLDSIFLAVKATKHISVSTIIGAAVNTIFNFIFISLYGTYGAALATVLGFSAGLIYRIIFINQYIQIRIAWKRQGISFLLLFFQMILALQGMKWFLLQTVILIVIMLLHKQYISDVFSKIKSKLMFEKK